MCAVDSATVAPSMPWSDPVITFRPGCAWSMVCVADSPSVGVKKDWPLVTTWTGLPLIAALNPL